jgi:hypothetical protein
MNESILPADLEELKELILSGDLTDEQLNFLIEEHCHAYLTFEDNERCQLCEYMAEEDYGFMLMEELIDRYVDRFTEQQISKFDGPSDWTTNEWFAEVYMGASGWRESRVQAMGLLIKLRTSKNAGYRTSVSGFFTFIDQLDQELFETWDGETTLDTARELTLHLTTFAECTADDLRGYLESYHDKYTANCDGEFDACDSCQDLLTEAVAQLK